jgi:hypothetical protein
MDIEFLPLLELQRDIYRQPAGAARFQTYLRELLNAEADDLALPLVNMNPMGKPHCLKHIEDLLAIDADSRVAELCRAIAGEFPHRSDRIRVGLCLVDDLHGGWTNRADVELQHRFQETYFYDKGWVIGYLWTSEPVAIDAVEREIRSVVHRYAIIRDHGPALTLQAMIEQEARVYRNAGITGPILDDEELAYTRHILEPHLCATDKRTCIECLFGDVAAESLGFTKRGLAPDAGLALAQEMARETA